MPYQWGGTSPRTGFDCSGLMQWAFKQQGIDIPRVAADQFHVGTPVDLAHLREGDLVFFQDSTGYIHHVGMYVGDHKFLEAPHTGDVVRYDNLNSPYWAQQFAGGRRIVPLDAPSARAESGSARRRRCDPCAQRLPRPRPQAPQGPARPRSAGRPPAGPGAAATPGVPEVAAASAPAPGTAAFSALQRQEHSFHRHTATFLAAIKPEQVTAPAPAPVAAVPGAAPVQAAGVVAPSGSAVPGTGVPAAGGSADQLVGQVSGASVSGGVTSVSSTLLTSGQEKFVAKLASLTGLDPKVLSRLVSV